MTTESDVAIGSPRAALTSDATMHTMPAMRDGRAGQGRRSHRWLGELEWNSSAPASADATVKAWFMNLAKRPADVCNQMRMIIIQKSLLLMTGFSCRSGDSPN
ncbi:hypothetical protein AWB66_03350 [Caballeronia telluris]|uniref:Uncharacterized protein n=1 Tax=Caballeronia telluris TaxID=326475 RepID=A0A158ISM2_9BURK|nr:hypothetical protein AWB66_03350 [Caballeronia telluris]